ncbi:MAG: DEAD/DEAH box helicase, partial [Oscillospiraceae bacterium]|nr:DEAD/DEAH box helicase [Oscillospiraceae bacterium]
DLCAFKEGVRTVCLYGGQPIEKQITQLKKQPQIVVATPGRLMDHMKRRTVRVDKVLTVVLDEADRMLDMGFVRDVTRILDQIKNRKNLGMFSATISREVLDISWVYQRDPVEITVRADERNKPDITQYRLDVDRNAKADTVTRLLELGGYDHAIAFCNTKNMTDRLAGLLRMRGVSCEAIHGDIQQRVREKTLQKFREGQMRVLVATDVAARGLDIDDVDAVFNYDVPDENEYYIHRIGRTGRAKRHGVAFSLVSSITEAIRLDDIRKHTGNTINHVRLGADGQLESVPEKE